MTNGYNTSDVNIPTAIQTPNNTYQQAVDQQAHPCMPQSPFLITATSLAHRTKLRKKLAPMCRNREHRIGGLHHLHLLRYSTLSYRHPVTIWRNGKRIAWPVVLSKDTRIVVYCTMQVTHHTSLHLHVGKKLIQFLSQQNKPRANPPMVVPCARRNSSTCNNAQETQQVRLLQH